MKITATAAYGAIFICICILDGIFSSSSPDNVGIAEAIIGLFLLILVGIRRSAWLLGVFYKNHLFLNSIEAPIYVKVSMLYLILFPSFYGIVILGNDLNDYIRDIIPLFYMFIPVLILPRIINNPERWLRYFIFGLCFIGLSYSFRYLISAGVTIEEIGKRLFLDDNQDNIMQDPATQFFFTFSFCMIPYFLFTRRYIYSILAFLVTLVPWAVMIASVMRAPVILTMVSMCIYLIFLMIFGAKRSLYYGVSAILLLITIVVFLLSNDVLMSALDLLYEKQQAVGLSSRDDEALAVINNIKSPATLLFGEGWGGLISNPIGDGAKWRFVHNFFVYFLFKSGIIGVLFVLTYLSWIFSNLIKVRYRISPVLIPISLSLISPLVISLVLEPMFKSLSFGFVLTFPLIIRLVFLQRSSALY